MTDATFSGWALVELMGHRQRAGEVREVEMFGAKLLRVDTPLEDGSSVTEFYGGGSIYAVRPCTEVVAKALARRMTDPRPIAPLDYRLPSPDLSREIDEHLVRGDDDLDEVVDEEVEDERYFEAFLGPAPAEDER